MMVRIILKIKNNNENSKIKTKDNYENKINIRSI